MSNRYLIIVTAFAATAAVPALATSAPGGTPRTQAPAAAAPAARPTTRAQVIQSTETSFRAIDANGDGMLTQAELAAAEAKGLQQRVLAVRQRLEAEFMKLDTNHDGQLSKAEFMAAAPQAPTTAPNGANLIAQLDKNHDGKVTIDEYRAPLLGRFDALDTNHDGVISDAEKQAAQARAKR